MLILVFDTSTRNGTVGWVKLEENDDFPKVLDFAHMYLPAIPGHAERLLERLEFCLKSGGFNIGDVDLIVIGRGPGTFTGLRIGFSTAKSLSLVHRFPLVTVSTLEMLACNAPAPGHVVALIDARRKEVYAGVFERSSVNGYPCAIPIGEEVVTSPLQISELLSCRNIFTPVQLVGDGAIAYASQFASLGVSALAPSVAIHSCHMAIHGFLSYKKNGAVNTALVEPEYLREPDARKPSKPFGLN
ncbi:MAG: tRNA (adenosine(37)-N6)-threonylcarbamoyltransferase complex dimerization subunit type 1 TsaB [Deltaproteobacteria bacterium]|nr:tRNA (adenosine(37)-N6)-threonylcarbamoyltransferase complex dimerization subunit type 1 TsaB [Deltaproteobacteria bacterium]